MLSELLDKLLGRASHTSRNLAKNRLRVVVAHDRADLAPNAVAAMQEEILEVVSRYVEVEREGLEFSLESDRRATTIVANFPVRRVRDAMPAVPTAADTVTDTVGDRAQTSPAPLEPESPIAESAISLQENLAAASQDVPPEPPIAEFPEEPSQKS